MMLHRFKVGQSLVFAPRRIGHPGGNQLCKVVRLMPVEEGECHYRIKCTYENVERVAKESQLSQQK
ncbi:MAG: hypothetical protein ACR2PG_17445 [Hyphomicrobiaceae bacterium]